MPDRRAAVKDSPEVAERDPFDPSPYTFLRQYRDRLFGFTELSAREYMKIRARATEKRIVPDLDTGMDREVDYYNRETEEKLLRAKCVKELDPETREPLASPEDLEEAPLRLFSAINRDIVILLYDPEEDQLAKQQAKQDRDTPPEVLAGNGR